jgi:hypothetical protein
MWTTDRPTLVAYSSEPSDSGWAVPGDRKSINPLAQRGVAGIFPKGNPLTRGLVPVQCRADVSSVNPDVAAQCDSNGHSPGFVKCCQLSPIGQLREGQARCRGSRHWKAVFRPTGSAPGYRGATIIAGGLVDLLHGCPGRRSSDPRRPRVFRELGCSPPSRWFRRNRRDVFLYPPKTLTAVLKL